MPSRYFPSLMLVVFMASGSGAVGPQQGAFSSRSTQGWQWTGPAEILEERMEITVHRDFLDVEHELVLSARGAWGPQQHADKLEILGNITLERGASVVGILVWYKHLLLKGKLKPRVEARKQYEEVVERNVTVPPPPRDPVLLEKGRGEDAYDISIFPVEWGKSRRIRLRYLIPARDGRLPYPHAFSSLSTAVVKPGQGTAGFRIQSDEQLSEAADVAVRLQAPAYRLHAQQSWPPEEGLLPRFLVPQEKAAKGSRVLVGSFTGHIFEGHMAHWFLEVPSDLLKGAEYDARTDRILATLGSAPDTCVLELPGPSEQGPGGGSLRIYHRDSLTARIRWTLRRGGQTIRSLDETAALERAQDGIQYARSFGGLPFYPMASTMPPSLGLALGFIDRRYSLVALEQDALAPADAAGFAAEGVPTLGPSDLFPDPKEAYDQPLMAWLIERGWTREMLLQPTRLGPMQGLPAGLRFTVRDGRLEVEIDPALRRAGKSLELAVHDLSGRRVHAWHSQELAAGRVSWAPVRGHSASASYVLRAVAGGRTWSLAFRIP